ncbi:MAG TPA: hypothetical protein VGG23_05955 [Acidimicrobiales bacterium]
MSSAASLLLAGGWAGVLDQVLPFHASASAKSAVLVLEVPTATQYVVDGQDTLISSPATRPFGSGGLAMVHVPPFQLSASAAEPVLVE